MKIVYRILARLYVKRSRRARKASMRLQKKAENFFYRVKGGKT